MTATYTAHSYEHITNLNIWYSQLHIGTLAASITSAETAAISQLNVLFSGSFNSSDS
jgi:hypothetical protein